MPRKLTKFDICAHAAREMGISYGKFMVDYGYDKALVYLPKEISVCPVCGDPFIPGNAKNRYCSTRCAERSRKKSSPTTAKQCEWCGEEFKLNPRCPTGRFCSTQCREKAYRERRKMNGQQIPGTVKENEGQEAHEQGSAV